MVTTPTEHQTISVLNRSARAAANVLWVVHARTPAVTDSPAARCNALSRRAARYPCQKSVSDRPFMGLAAVP
jgi:hypothetical protein